MSKNKREKRRRIYVRLPLRSVFNNDPQLSRKPSETG